MTYLETQLVDRCNRLMVLLFLEEVRVRHLVEQNRQANGVIETAAETLQKMTEVLCRTVGALDGAGQRPA